MRVFKNSITLSLIMMMCVGISTSQSTPVEEGSDHAGNDSDQNTAIQFDKASMWSTQPAFQIADRQGIFQHNTEMENLMIGLNTKKLFRNEVMHESVDHYRFNEVFFQSIAKHNTGTVDIDRNLIEYGVQRDLLHQRAQNEDNNVELRGWYTVGVVSAMLITGSLIYLLSGDDGSPSIPEPPGRP